MTTVRQSAASATVRGFEGMPIIDCDVHNEPGDALVRYLPRRWAEYLALVGNRSNLGTVALGSGMRPFVSRLDSVPPSGGIPGSDPDFAREQLLDEYGISAAILNNISVGSGNIPVELECALIHASNEYTQEWLDADPRWLASISVTRVDPLWSAKEIHHWRETNKRFVQVLMNATGERPAGNPMHWPIFEAAAELGIPVAFHVGGYTPRQSLSSGVGATSFYFEQRTSLDILGQDIATSLIFEGVFDRWPNLQVVLVEMDWTWAVPFAWRLDSTWRVLGAEVPELERRPSEYLRDHFWYSTQPALETEHQHQLLAVYRQLERAGFADRLMFASDYPHWDMDSPFETTPRSLSGELKQKILAGNAARLYDLDVELPT